MSTTEEQENCCRLCVFNFRAGEQLQCRRNPPVRAGVNGFPVVTEDCWCGEFRPRRKKRQGRD